VQFVHQSNLFKRVLCSLVIRFDFRQKNSKMLMAIVNITMLDCHTWVNYDKRLEILDSSMNNEVRQVLFTLTRTILSRNIFIERILYTTSKFDCSSRLNTCTNLQSCRQVAPALNKTRILSDIISLRINDVIVYGNNIDLYRISKVNCCSNL
jgi:hypothetical protein